MTVARRIVGAAPAAAAGAALAGSAIAGAAGTGDHAPLPCGMQAGSAIARADHRYAESSASVGRG